LIRSRSRAHDGLSDGTFDVNPLPGAAARLSGSDCIAVFLCSKTPVASAAGTLFDVCMDPAVPARDQRCVSRGICKILESLTCGGFPIRSAWEIGVRRNSDQGADVMRVFLKTCDSHSKRQYQAAPFRGQRRKTTPWASALATVHRSHAGSLPTWETGVTKSSSNCGSQSQNVFAAHLSERHNHAYDRRRSTLYSSDHIVRCVR
jgi:hypothetical protein